MEWPSGSLVFLRTSRANIILRRDPKLHAPVCSAEVACICGLLVRKRVGQIFLSIPREVFRRSSYSSECSACCFQFRLCCAHRPALLEAFPAEDRSPLCGTKGNSGFLPALRTVCFRFRAYGNGAAAT